MENILNTVSMTAVQEGNVDIKLATTIISTILYIRNNPALLLPLYSLFFIGVEVKVISCQVLWQPFYSGLTTTTTVQSLVLELLLDGQRLAFQERVPLKHFRNMVEQRLPQI